MSDDSIVSKQKGKLSLHRQGKVIQITIELGTMYDAMHMFDALSKEDLYLKYSGPKEITEKDETDADTDC